MPCGRPNFRHRANNNAPVAPSKISICIYDGHKKITCVQFTGPLSASNILTHVEYPIHNLSTWWCVSCNHLRLYKHSVVIRIVCGYSVRQAGGVGRRDGGRWGRLVEPSASARVLWLGARHRRDGAFFRGGKNHCLSVCLLTCCR